MCVCVCVCVCVNFNRFSCVLLLGLVVIFLQVYCFFFKYFFSVLDLVILV